MSRAGGAETGFTLIELLVVLTILAIASAIALPRFRTWRDPSLRQVTRAVAIEVRTARTKAIRSGRVTQLAIPSLLPRVPASMRLGGGPIVFYPDGRSSGGRVSVSDAVGEAAVEVDWLTGTVRVTP